MRNLKMTEYRMKKHFEGYWTLERLYVDRLSPKDNGWHQQFHGSYDKCKSEYDEIMARKAYIPLILTPPFPDTDPIATFKRKFFKWF